jgi:hypothetical protein
MTHGHTYSVRIGCDGCPRKGEATIPVTDCAECDHANAMWKAARSMVHTADCKIAKRNGYEMETSK